MNTIHLTDEQLRLLQAILISTMDTRSCLCVAEQLGVAFDEDGTWNTERVDQIERTFDELLAASRIGA